jgi:hypothetical protein
MGSISYNFLAESILFNEAEFEKGYPSLSDNQLENLLQDYRQFCITNLSDLTNEVKDNKSSLKVLSGIDRLNFETLKQSSLYFDQFVVYDPIFQLTKSNTISTDAFSEYLGYEKSNVINRQKLVQAAQFLKKITPMVAGDFVKILPLSYIFESPKEVPVKLPVNFYADSIPKELMEYCRSKIIVKSMKQLESGGWQILDQQDQTAGLFIEFEGRELEQGFIYNYLNQEFKPTEDPFKFITKMTLPEYPMDKSIWDLWVFQSMNASSKAVVEKIYAEFSVANNLRSTYLTDCEFTSGLVTKNISSIETVETASATQFMNIQLPFMDKIDIDKLMAIRTNDAETFTNFRMELERQFRELRTVTDPKELKIRQENIIHELGTVQVKKIERKLDSLKRKGYADATLLLAGLTGTVQTAGWSLIASAIAVASGYKTYREYKDNLVENPSYLLWKVLKK